MQRISTSLSNNDVQNNLRRQEHKLNKVNNQLGTQQKLQSLRDDPIAAGHLVRYQSYAKRIEQFRHNAETLSDQFIMSESYVDNSLQIMHRVRELAVTGAHGIYNKEDLAHMASEVDELLKELVQNANAIDADGNALFAGERSKNQAFLIDKGNTTGSDSELIQRVRYNGSIKQNEVEVDEHSYMAVNRNGNQVFWAESQQLIAQRDASAFTLLEDAKISINGTDISLKTGDTIHAIISKINNSGAPVKASLDPMAHSLMLNTTDSRQIWLEDISGNTLESLGLIKDSSQRPPYNLNDSVLSSGGSIFDTVIALRNAMLNNDSESIGGKILGSLDQAVNNLTSSLTEFGAKYERALSNIARAENTSLNVTSQISREGDLDITTAITDMKMLEYVRNATLSTAGKLYNSTLLNYIR